MTLSQNPDYLRYGMVYCSFSPYICYCEHLFIINMSIRFLFNMITRYWSQDSATLCCVSGTLAKTGFVSVLGSRPSSLEWFFRTDFLRFWVCRQTRSGIRIDFLDACTIILGFLLSWKVNGPSPLIGVNLTAKHWSYRIRQHPGEIVLHLFSIEDVRLFDLDWHITILG